MELFATCAPGLEPYLERELRALNVAGLNVVPGGVAFSGGLPELYRANLHLRTAGRVLVRLGRFHASEFWQLHKRAARLPWEKYLRPGQPLALRATCHKSKLYHSDGVAERVAKAIGERLGQPVAWQPSAPAEDGELTANATAAQWIVIRLDHDECTISLDSSGELLHRRGYRLATAKAPLRETLAAGVLMASGWRPGQPLLDPFCGSGTLPIEAALMALAIPPGRARDFAFRHWPGYDAALFESLRGQQEAPASARLPIGGSDRDAGAIEAARANAERAGVAASVEFVQRTISAITSPADSGWIVTNPPYGVRVSQNRDLRDLYAAFGRVLRERFRGWHIAFLCPDAALAHHTGLALAGSPPSFAHGGLTVRLWQGRVSAI
jgi:putative N6-adenine-specific DNA methylase